MNFLSQEIFREIVGLVDTTREVNSSENLLCKKLERVSLVSCEWRLKIGVAAIVLELSADMCLEISAIDSDDVDVGIMFTLIIGVAFF